MKSLQDVNALLAKFERQYGLPVLGAQQGSAAWMNLKLGVISASCAKDVVAKKGTETRANYLAELVAQVATGQMEEISSKHLDWGNQHEDGARGAYEFSEGVEVTQLPFAFKDDSFRIGCSPDGVASNGKAVEIKCPSNSANYVRFLVEKKIKPEYQWQYNFQLWVLDAEKMDFVQYDPRMNAKPVAILEVTRDEEKIKALEDLVPEFILEMDSMLKEIGIPFGSHWKSLAQVEAAV